MFPYSDNTPAERLEEDARVDAFLLTEEGQGRAVLEDAREILRYAELERLGPNHPNAARIRALLNDQE